MPAEHLLLHDADSLNCCCFLYALQNLSYFSFEGGEAAVELPASGTVEEIMQLPRAHSHLLAYLLPKPEV